MSPIGILEQNISFCRERIAVLEINIESWRRNIEETEKEKVLLLEQIADFERAISKLTPE